MLKTKVIASHVTNLTDARYFAARGADFLLFDLDDITIDAALEIKEWVEGPEILLLISTSKTDQLDEAVLRLKPNYMAGKSGDVIADIAHLSAHVPLFQWSNDEISLDDNQYQMLSDKISIDNLPQGIIVRGGEETAVGVKSFDDLDDFFDAIEELI